MKPLSSALWLAQHNTREWIYIDC